MVEADTYYIQIPVLLEWDIFENMTNAIKYNLGNNKFDAALTSVYYEKGMMDLIRIYDTDTDKQRLNLILAKYMEAIKRL